MILDTKDSAETQYFSTKQDDVTLKKTVTLIVLSVTSSNPIKHKTFILKIEQK